MRLFPYGADGQQRLKQLRQEHWSTHVFRREGANQIVAVPITAGAPVIGDSEKKIRLKDNLGLTSVLIRNALLNYLVSLGRPVLHYDPVRFIARDDILRPALPSGVACPEWLSVRMLYDVTSDLFFQAGTVHCCNLRCPYHPDYRSDGRGAYAGRILAHRPLCSEALAQI